MPDKLMSAMNVDSSIAGTERLLAQGADGSVILVSAISAYVIDDLIASDAATPTTGDYILGFRGTDEKTMTLDNVAAYTVAYAWSAASTASPALTADSLLINRGGTVYDVTIDDVKTFALTGVQATVLNLSGLGAATLANTDLLAICQTTTAKKATIASLETLLWTDYATYVAARDAATLGDTDLFYCIQGGVPKKIAASGLATYMVPEVIADATLAGAVLDTLDTYLAALSAVGTLANADLLYCTQGGTAKKLDLLSLSNFTTAAALQMPWKPISTDKYTATPSSTSVITMSDTSDFKLGAPAKYTYGAITYYGIVTALSANTSITVSGAPLVVASPLSALYVGLPSLVTQMDFLVPGVFAGSVRDILVAINSQYAQWKQAAAYLCQFAVTQGTADTGANQAKINCKIGGSAVFTGDSNKGLALSATPGTWNDASIIEVNTTNYSVARGDAIEVSVTYEGSNKNAEDLSVTMLFVSE